MASILTENVRDLVRQLIYCVSGFDESSEFYSTIQDFAFSHIASPDYFFSYTKRDIEQTINNLAEKFRFHGFLEQAEAIINLTKKFFDSSTSRDDLEIRVSVMKLLLITSHSPTNKFIENPKLYKPKNLENTEVIDWAAFLKDTKTEIIQNFTDTEDSWSELSDTETENLETKVDEIDLVLPTQKSSEFFPKVNLQDEAKIAKDNLLKSIQNFWWNSNFAKFIPSSSCTESTVALEWDKFVSRETLGLVSQNTNIIPEYKIMRELIWQFFAPNTCFTFGFENGKILPKNDVTICSVRSHIFQYFLHEFVPYIEIMDVFYTFRHNLLGEYYIASTPDSYRSYSDAIQEILDPVYLKIKDIETQIKKQEEITTFLILANKLRPIFKDLEILYIVHTEIMKEFNVEKGYKNSTYLLSRLYYGLLNSSNLTEQNLFLTLYLKSLYKYFTIIEIWLTQDLLQDLSDEFIIIHKNTNIEYQNEDWKMEFIIRDLDPISQMDGMLNIICTKILQLAKNIHLLRLLGKLYMITNEFGSFNETLHEEYIRKVLEQAVIYSKETTAEQLVDTTMETKEDLNKLAVICPEQKTSQTGMDSVKNILDFSDGFLFTVFENYLYSDKKMKNKKTVTLFQMVNEKIGKMFPAKQILEKVFLEVLDSRYSIPGLMVKNMLINQFNLKKYFQLMKHLYLFEDDIIFPFYKKMFKQFESQQIWGNFYWLTSQLQDLLMDLYPDYYEFCRVDVEPNWRLCTNPIVACDLVSVHCKINWPINIIIRVEHIFKYHDVFQFILKIKWAMNTLNRLSFGAIEPKTKPFKLQTVLIKQRIRKLQSMRLFLLNDVSSIQHYLLGYLFSEFWKKFDKDLEDSYDLDSIVNAHNKFIKRIHSFCTKLKEEMSEIYGFKKILNLVLQLNEMWNNMYDIDDDFLNSCEIEYRKCHKFLRPIIDMELTTF